MDHPLNDTDNSPILRTYILIKEQFETESYISLIDDFKLRRAIAQIRLSSHHLQVELGRHCKPKIPSDKRFCKCCNSKMIDDEMHFMLNCTLCQEERITLFSNLLVIEPGIFQSSNPEEVFISLFNSCNQKSLFYIATFIRKCMKKRKLFISQGN